ncbi:MAG: hypothetical protein DRI74_03095 [Bacteroidetes bacterium]|nr:MAG: hypothetical protein DRI74_03095 [Bacteroidota bacterium]
MKKTLLFKSIALSLFMLLSIGVLNAQVSLPHYEGFDYTTGETLGEQANWTNLNTGDEVLISDGSLSYTDFISSTGNSISFNGKGFDPQLQFDEVTSGTVYTSFLFKVTDQSAMTDLSDGGYFAVLGNYDARLWVKPNPEASGTTFDIGFGWESSNPAAVSSTTYNVGDVILAVMSYNIDNNELSAWINPNSSDFGASTAPTATLTSTDSDDVTSLSAFVVRQDSDGETPFMVMDELRIGTSWADVTSEIVTPTGFDVTFNVDMSGATGFTAGTDVVYIGGDIAGGWAEPGSDATYEMTDTDGDGIYTITLTKDPVGDIEYKYFVNAGWNGGEWTGGDNRTATIEEETTLNDVFGKYIYKVALATAPFYAGDNVTTTWSSYGVDNIKMDAWVPSEGSWTELIASTPSDGTEDFSIPEDAWNGDYKIRLSDVTNAAVNAVSAEFEIIAKPSIYEIQSNTSDGDLSDYDGQKVQVSGVVTAIAGNNFWIQTPPLKDSQYPEWSAIFAYDATTAAALAIGDDVTLEATVDEYYNATELVSVTSSTINSQGNTIAAVAVTAAAALESYESTLITIMDAEVTSDPDSNGEFTVNDGTADYIVDDKIFAYTPTIGEVLDVTGVVAFSYGAFKLYPRDADDITVASGVGIDDLSASSISVYPNPSNGKFYVQMGDAFKVNTKIEVFNVVGMKVFETLSNNFKTEIDLSTMKQGVYYVRVDDGENIITQKIMKQ